LPGTRLHLAERAEEDVRDRAVHGLRHEKGEQRAGGADEHPGDDENGRVEHEAGRRRGQSRERVQERDDDRHVRAADREHEHDAEHEREQDQRDDRPLRLEPDHDGDAQRCRTAEDDDVHDVLAGEDDRSAAHQLLQLREGDERAGERDRADQRRQGDREALVPDEDAVELVELRERDERRRPAADPVEQGHHLRHRGHLHLPRADHSDHAPDRGGDDDQRPVRDPLDEQRGRDRDEHPHAAQPVAAPRVLRGREKTQRQDEADDRDEVEK
jgi:hypothetical protein